MTYTTPNTNVLRPNGAALPLSAVLNTIEYNNMTDTEVCLGLNDNGIMSLDLKKAPHVLIAGQTGAGKSVMMHNIIISLMAKNTPNMAQLVMIDPKRVELSMYKGSAMLWRPIAKGTDESLSALDEVVEEMESRYKAMEKMGVRNFPQNWKRIYIIIDELADLMLTAKKKVEKDIVRIAQLGRACGIHLIIATQTPRKDVLTGLIKANIPCRIALPVANHYESMIILDEVGAEELGKPGQAILRLGLNKIRFSGAYVSDEEIEAITRQTIHHSWLSRLIHV